MTGKTCPQCSKVFSRPGVMRAHLKAVHLGEKPFQCPQCPKAFGYKQALDEHARIAHQDVRPHACTNCNRRFHKAADLKKHQAIHARKGFVYRSSREEHVARLLEEEGLAFEREVRVDFEGGGLARLDFLLRMDWGLCALEVDEGAHCLREQAEEAERMLKVVSAKTQAFRRSSSLTSERTLDLGRGRLHEHQIRDLHEDAPAGGHEPALAHFDPHLAAPAGQIPKLLQRLAAGVPDAHAIPVELELEEAVPAGAGPPAALHAGLHLVLNLRKLFPRALVLLQLCMRASTSWGARDLPKILVSEKECLDSSCTTCCSSSSSSRPAVSSGSRQMGTRLASASLYAEGCHRIFCASDSADCHTTGSLLPSRRRGRLLPPLVLVKSAPSAIAMAGKVRWSELIPVFLPPEKE
eukprot:s8192_g3.t1